MTDDYTIGLAAYPMRSYLTKIGTEDLLKNGYAVPSDAGAS